MRRRSCASPATTLAASASAMRATGTDVGGATAKESANVASATLTTRVTQLCTEACGMRTRRGRHATPCGMPPPDAASVSAQLVLHVFGTQVLPIHEQIGSLL